MGKTDAFDPLPHRGEDDEVEIRGDIMQRVWAEAAALRQSGELLKLAGQVQCPVVALHGDYDPHPAEGVERPLARIITDFRFIRLEACGHEPWIERQARDRFFAILGREIPNVG
jgi:pimeloyl-ACP methyl ester carboxylesterase